VPACSSDAYKSRFLLGSSGFRVVAGNRGRKKFYITKALCKPRRGEGKRNRAGEVLIITLLSKRAGLAKIK